jgi:ketosteroid isomerase-like protein
MTTTYQRLSAAFAVVVCLAGIYFALGFGATAQSDDERLIRSARARSNQAIAAHDLTVIASVWMEDVHIVSSTSALTAGRELNRERMARQFANRPDTVYVRRPTAIEVYPAWAVASERGEWTGRWTEPDGALEIGGTYQAQWRKIDGQWRVQAELYVPTSCTGAAYCRQRPQGPLPKR